MILGKNVRCGIIVLLMIYLHSNNYLNTWLRSVNEGCIPLLHLCMLVSCGTCTKASRMKPSLFTPVIVLFQVKMSL